MDALSWIQVETLDGSTVFRPGDEVAGTASWRLAASPEAVEVRLFWYTQGKGQQDVEVVETVRLEAPGAADRRAFRFHLPRSPYSFSGKLISLVWAIEAEAAPGGEVGRLELVVSPTGEEILLTPVSGDARPG
jgi:hypothetical protein